MKISIAQSDGLENKKNKNEKNLNFFVFDSLIMKAILLDNCQTSNEYLTVYHRYCGTIKKNQIYSVLGYGSFTHTEFRRLKKKSSACRYCTSQNDFHGH